MDALIATMRRAIPGFCERVLTHEDFLAACKREGITVETSSTSTFTSPAAAADRASRSYLRFAGWLHRIELEVSTVGLG